MKVEIRNNGVRLDGYVNVHSRDSRQLPSPRGLFVEQIMPNAMGDALRKTDSVDLLFNHREDRKLGSTKEGNLTLYEDSIGLRAICDVSDAEVIDKAKRGELRGWSFGFIATEQRWVDGSGTQRRFVDGLDLLEVSILDCTPAYFATTIEARGEESVVSETRFEEFRLDPNDKPADDEEAKEDANEEQSEPADEESKEDAEEGDKPVDEGDKPDEKRDFIREIELIKLKGLNR